jgi:beta-N-acetylhexosaminidase
LRTTRWSPRTLLALALSAGLAACARVCPSAHPAGAGARSGAGVDAEADRRWVEATLHALTLRQKAAQLLMPGTGGDYVATDTSEFERLRHWVEDAGVGGITLSIGLPHSYAAKLNALQRHACVPLLVASNMEAGAGERLAGAYSIPHLRPQGGGTFFPPAMAFGAIGDEAMAAELGRITAVEARAVGVHLSFSPDLDVNSNPANPIINTRAFGENPALVARLGTAYIRGARAAGLMTTAKHFPGHGDTATDSHLELPVLTGDRARLSAVELPPFRAAVEAGVDGVMSAHIAARAIEGATAPPATLSRYFMTRVLRDDLHFDGIVMTDAMDMAGITKHFGDVEAPLRALEAGADLLVKPMDVDQTLDAIVAAVKKGRLTEARIDHSVRRILEAKARVGLRTGALVDLDAVEERVGTAAHQRVAAEAARRAITLLRDERSLVPLPAAARRILSITYAEPVDLIAGRELNATLAAGGHSVAAVRVDDRTTAAEWSQLAARAATADAVVASAYIAPRELVGSVAAGSGFAGFVRRLAAERRPVVVISFGSPYLLSSFPDVPAYLLAWSRIEVCQQAAADALLGRAPITGRLPVSLPPRYAAGAGIERRPAAAH